MRSWPVVLCALFFCPTSFVSALGQEPTWQELEIRGLYVFGHATSTIAPCSSGQPSWLDGSGQAARELHNAYDASVDALLEPMYVVLRGKFDPDFDTGDYFVGRFVLEEFVEYSVDPEVIAECEAEAAGR